MSSRSKVRASFFSSAVSVLDAVRVAPSWWASSILRGLEVKAVTSQPHLFKNMDGHVA